MYVYKKQIIISYTDSYSSRYNKIFHNISDASFVVSSAEFCLFYNVLIEILSYALDIFYVNSI